MSLTVSRTVSLSVSLSESVCESVGESNCKTVKESDCVSVCESDCESNCESVYESDRETVKSNWRFKCVNEKKRAFHRNRNLRTVSCSRKEKKECRTTAQKAFIQAAFPHPFQTVVSPRRAEHL